MTRRKKPRTSPGTPLVVAVALAAIFQLSPVTAVTAGAPDLGKIVRLDPRFNRLVPRDAVLEKVAGGFTWVEGPTWNREGGYLLFSDIPNN